MLIPFGIGLFFTVHISSFTSSDLILLLFSICLMLVWWMWMLIHLYFEMCSERDFLLFKSCVLYAQFYNPQQPLVSIEVVAHVTSTKLRKGEVITVSHTAYTDATILISSSVNQIISLLSSRCECYHNMFANIIFKWEGLQHISLHLHNQPWCFEELFEKSAMLFTLLKKRHDTFECWDGEANWC
jgi:hypothetical protein